MGIRQDLTFALASTNRQLGYVPPDDPYYAELLETRARQAKALAALTPETEAERDAEIAREVEELDRQEEEAWRDDFGDEENDDDDEEGEEEEDDQ